jgi:signal transduction histidine kinase
LSCQSGNVAHDLRTPLQAFQSELEILRGNVKSGASEKENIALSSIKQLERICNFMNMTINRSIDFTKASSGIKLNPSIESINFSETMKWAVGCMVKSHTIPIVVAPIPTDIYNQIYTDKQWLMENLMCLLSNAQKFTTEGDITIRCSLHSSLKRGVIQKTELPAATESKGTNCDEDSAEDDIEMGCLRSSVEEKEAPMLLIEVEDTGIGITKENREKLFKPFMQVWYPICVLMSSCTVPFVL